jgi:pimeloyl-ACP methyl ester carboxylesterase
MTRESLPAAIDADSARFASELGALHFYSDTTAAGRPLLLLHSVNAAPSAMEIKPLFERYRGTRPVYAPELPGFGRSRRGDQDYSAEAYARVLAAFLREVIGEPADVVVLSLSCEFVARAAPQTDGLVASIAMISPTGLGTRELPSLETGARLGRVFRVPLVSDALYRTLTTRASIRYFLGKSFVGEVPEELVEYAWRTTREPGAKYAPFRFLTFTLFTRGIRDSLYAALSCPVLVLYDRDANVGFEALPDMLERHDNWRAERVAPSLGLPHWERTAATSDALDAFWREAGNE